METQGIIVNNRWRLGRKIGSGGFGAVYTGTDINTGAEIALKMAPLSQHRPTFIGSLANEAEAFRGVAGRTRGGKRGIPHALWDGEEGDYYVLATDLLGPSLEDLLHYCGGHFSLKTILLIAEQAITLLETIHKSDWLHRDVKPHNFLMGTGREGHTLYAIDMGLSRSWERAELSHQHTPAHIGREFIGTPEFGSIDNHRGKEQSFKDDLESLGYMLLYFRMGYLPWDAHGNQSRNTDKMGQLKEATELDTVCNASPDEFKVYLDYLRKLEFYDIPDYRYLRKLFRDLFRRMGYRYDNVYDWTQQIWHEHYGATNVCR